VDPYDQIQRVPAVGLVDGRLGSCCQRLPQQENRGQLNLDPKGSSSKLPTSAKGVTPEKANHTVRRPRAETYVTKQGTGTVQKFSRIASGRGKTGKPKDRNRSTSRTVSCDATYLPVGTKKEKNEAVFECHNRRKGRWEGLRKGRKKKRRVDRAGKLALSTTLHHHILRAATKSGIARACGEREGRWEKGGKACFDSRDG